MEYNKDNVQTIQDTYDVVVIGGGPGGLSAGLYSHRFLLKTLVIDKGRGRSFWVKNLTNYIGTPAGTPGTQVLKQGKEQYLSLGGDMLNGFVTGVQDDGEKFAITVQVGRVTPQGYTIHTRYIIAASGVMDVLPQIADQKNVFDYAGYNMNVCMVCDGYEMHNKKVGLFVNSEDRTQMAHHLAWFTKDIIIFTNNMFELSDTKKKELEASGCTVYTSEIKQFIGSAHHLESVELSDGQIVKFEQALISMGSTFNNKYLKQIDKLNWSGENLKTDIVCRTTHERIFCVGDLKVGMNQFSIAVGDGANAAIAIWKDYREKKIQPIR